MLREHKRRVVGYIESTIPDHALDMGTSVMVMQTVCKTPGCVPLETSVVIVFPRDNAQHIEGLPESCGGSFKAKILMPLSDVTLDDVLDSLPPGFKGGRKTWEKTCLNIRDYTLGRIAGTVGFGDTEIEVKEREMLSEYLIACLQDYMKNGCMAPDFGMPFPERQMDQSHKDISILEGKIEDTQITTRSNECYIEKDEKSKSEGEEQMTQNSKSIKITDINHTIESEAIEGEVQMFRKEPRNYHSTKPSHL